MLIIIAFCTAGAKEKPPSTRAWLPASQRDQAYLYCNRNLPTIHKIATTNFKHPKLYSVSFPIPKKTHFWTFKKIAEVVVGVFSVMKKMLVSKAYCPEIKLLAPKGTYSKITHLCNLKGSPLFCLFSVNTTRLWSMLVMREEGHCTLYFHLERNEVACNYWQNNLPHFSSTFG